jgi:hypothetical protein
VTGRGGGSTGGADSSIGPLPGFFVYPFFLVHMGVFGLTGFVFAYSGMPAIVVLINGASALAIYLVFYRMFFGRDEVRWMFINGALGVLGIASQIDFVLSLFGRHVADFAWYVHIVPFLYWIMYTFLLRHAALDLFGARDDEARRAKVQLGYVLVSIAIYALTHVLGF